MATLSRYYQAEAEAIQAAAREVATAKKWPDYLTAAIPAFFGHADERTDPGDGGRPGRGAWLSALSAIWISELDEEPAEGWTKVGGIIGEAADLALRDDWKTRKDGSAFLVMWGDVKKAFLYGAEGVANAVKTVGTEVGKTAKMITWAALLLGGAAVFSRISGK